MQDTLELLGVFVAISSPIWIIYFIKKYAEHRTRVVELRARAQQEQSAGDVAALQRQIGKLTERVQVLEAIVTDEGYQLQEKFRQL